VPFVPQRELPLRVPDAVQREGAQISYAICASLIALRIRRTAGAFEREEPSGDFLDFPDS
jgi:hypothetical protein